MQLEYNTEEYELDKFHKYLSVVSKIFIIFAVVMTIMFLVSFELFVLWLVCLIFGIIVGFLYIYLMMKKVAENEPNIIIEDDTITCNFRRVETEPKSLKRRLYGQYIQINEECKLKLITQYEVTTDKIIVWGYDAEKEDVLTGFTLERYFYEDHEILITTWLQNHILFN